MLPPPVRNRRAILVTTRQRHLRRLLLSQISISISDLPSVDPVCSYNSGADGVRFRPATMHNALVVIAWTWHSHPGPLNSDKGAAAAAGCPMRTRDPANTQHNHCNDDSHCQESP